MKFEFKNSGKKIDFETLKKRILSKSNQIYHITHNKLMTESDFRKEIEEKETHTETSVLKNAPHTLQMATADKWSFEYSRQKALYPLNFVHENKFWPSVRRVDEAFGDRNLICSCPPIEEYSNN